MKFVISFLISFLLIFTNTVFASEVESTVSSDSPFKTLQDFIDGGTQGLEELRGVASSFGDFADASIQTLINAPVKAVASNFLACSQDMIDTSVDALVASRDFMSNIFVDTINKTFSWNTETVKFGHDVLVDRFGDYVTSGSPSGFVSANYEHWWISKIDPPGIPATTNYACFQDYNNNVFFTTVNDSTVVICSYSDSPIGLNFGSRYGGAPSSNGSVTTHGSVPLSYGYTINGKTYYYNYTSLSSFISPGDIFTRFPSSYSDADSAVSSFYNFKPTEEYKPNGKGWFRPLPQNTTVKANGNNVYNVNWGDIIVSNYNTYGDTFENTVINNYYYSATNPSTPNYWYDVYDDNNPVVIPSHDYDDLTDITLANPNIVANHNFITDVFSSIPVIISTLFISLLLLSIVIMFLKG